MQIYRTTNTANGKWYIGKDEASNPQYLGSGTILKAAIAKYGRANFVKEVLEECSTSSELKEREKHWISTTGAQTNSMSYNLAAGGDGGDWTSSKSPEEVAEIYARRGNQTDNFAAAHQWYQDLSPPAQRVHQQRLTNLRCRGWWVSRLDDPSETFVLNLREWCDQNGINTGHATAVAKIGSKLYGKQAKGWRVRKDGDPLLPLYVNKRKQSKPNDACRGKSWRLVDGKRVWFEKGE